MRSLLALIFFLSQALSINLIPLPQVKIEILNPGSSYIFGENISFDAQIQPAGSAKEVNLYLKTSEKNIQGYPAQISESGMIKCQVDISKFSLTPFSKFTYWYTVITFSGETIKSAEFSFQYNDNRFNWKTLENNPFQINWYEGDQDFSQLALAVAKDGLSKAQSYIPINSPALVRIFIYAQPGDLQSALQLSKQSWVAGHTNPELGMILVSIGSGQDKRLEMERQIPHEIMHVLLYQVSGERYSNFPLWFSEGLASLTETNSNSDYQSALYLAINQRNLIPMNSLCIVFPRETSGAILAYAQSASFVKFLHQKFGSSGMNKIIEEYKDGLGCEEGIAAGLNSSLNELEKQWKEETLGINPGLAAWEDFAPYLVLLLVLILPMIGLGIWKTSNQRKLMGKDK